MVVNKEAIGGSSGIPKDFQPHETSWTSRKEYIGFILDKYKGTIPENVWNESISIIDKAFRENENPSETATSAFFVHTRRYRKTNVNVDGEVFKHLDDSTRCLPILDPKHGMTEEDVELLWNSMPPFKVGEVKGTLNGKDIKCAIISIPITPYALEQHNGTASRVNYARSRIIQAAELAKRMGAKTVGLGETLASLTDHGTKLKEKVSDVAVVTGHDFTTDFMNEIYNQTARDLDIDPRESQTTVIGAFGSIGTAMTEVLLAEGVRKFHLHDRKIMITALEKRKNEILERADGRGKKLYPNAQIEITGGDDQLKKACEGSKIVLVAASAPEPFIKAEHVDPGTVIINDSQPPSMTSKEAKRGRAKTIWVVGKLPDGFKNTFNYGLVGNAEWTCLLEVIATDAGGYTAETGRVTLERATCAREARRKLKIGLASPQSWGEPVPLVPSPIEVLRTLITEEIREVGQK